MTLANLNPGHDIDASLVARAVALQPLLAANAGSRHAFLATNPSLETYGRSLLGQDPIYLVTEEHRPVNDPIIEVCIVPRNLDP
jgi:hypothetical protein